MVTLVNMVAKVTTVTMGVFVTTVTKKSVAM
jgi:hypothetical protein